MNIETRKRLRRFPGKFIRSLATPGRLWKSAAVKPIPSSGMGWIISFHLDITLIHGPGCPVCVTPIELIDTACELAKLSNVIFCSFGDMLRVPGTQEDLLNVKAQGGDVRIIYSPLDASCPRPSESLRQIVIFAVGFETTAPAQAMAIHQAQRMKLKNFFVLVAHVLVPPAMEALLSSPENRVQGFLAAGHVCTIMGYEMYEPISEKYHVPIVVTGFEPVDILEG